MPEQSSLHSHLNWAKQRLDEMDATLASLESKAGQTQAASKAKAEQLVVELKKRRDEFRTVIDKEAKAGEAAWQRLKPQLESQWNGFESQVKTYFDAVGQQAEQQWATFRGAAAAQTKAWREAAERLGQEAANVAAAQRTSVEAAVKQLRVDAAAAETRLQGLKQAASESWSALSAALAESRKAFDRGNQAAWSALKRAEPAKEPTADKP
jgi:hypothetical protein